MSFLYMDPRKQPSQKDLKRFESIESSKRKVEIDIKDGNNEQNGEEEMM